MNTKKADWINKPERISMSLHSLSFHSEGRHCVFFTIGESGSITIEIKKGDASFVFLHTHNDAIRFSENGIGIRMFSFSSRIPIAAGRSMRMEKNGEDISFYSDGNMVLSISNKAFLSSASFGAMTDKEGEVGLEVF